MPSSCSIAGLRAEHDAEFDRDVVSWGGSRSLDGLSEVFRRFERQLIDNSSLDDTQLDEGIRFCHHALASLEPVRARHAGLVMHPLFQMIADRHFVLKS